MGYLIREESETRLAAVRRLMATEDLDVALVYYDEFNIGNGWYLTGWCPQFESGAVLVPGMTVCIDVSFFGHPECHGMRIETGYEITDRGAEPLSAKMDRRFLE